MSDKKEKKSEQKPKRSNVPVCEENAYIKDKKVRENTGLTDKAKILMG